MRFILTLLPFAIGSLAQHVHFEPPEIEAWVGSMMVQFEPWQHGPTPTGNHPRPTQPVPAPKAACDYWLENIKHQGIAAFNANPAAYQVFRNVKDFGAKGRVYHFHGDDDKLIESCAQVME